MHITNGNSLNFLPKRLGTLEMKTPETIWIKAIIQHEMSNTFQYSIFTRESNRSGNFQGIGVRISWKY